MTPFKAGDVVAVEFPFSDFQGLKRRPGLIIVGGEPDVLVARVNTRPPRERSDVALRRWAEAGLPRASAVRLTKLAAVDLRLVHHKVGRLDPEDGRAVFEAWQQMTAFLRAELLK